MRFSVVLISSLNGERQDREYTEKELTAIVGSYVVSRAVKLGQTNTTIIIKGTSYKMQIKHLK